MMKQKLLFLSMALLTVFTACKKNENMVQPISLSYNLTVNNDEAYAISAARTAVKITNTTNGQEYTAVADEQGKVTFASILPGVYNVNASLVFTAAEFTAISGNYTKDDVAFNSTVNNGQYFTDMSVDLILKTGKIGDWVIKQVYYAGSHVTKGASFRDVFIEFYNNSNAVLYADSLYFGQAMGKNNDDEGTYYQSNFQYDWSKAIGMSANGNANEDYIYAHTMFMIPSDGTGKKYPVEPGKSFIVAATGINHQASYVVNDGEGTVQSIADPTLTIDLSKADFETYIVDYLRLNTTGTFTPYKFDLDNPNVANVEVIQVSAGKDLVMNALGRDAFFLLSTSGTNVNPKNWPLYHTPDVREATTGKAKYTQVPVDYILDAIELQHPIASSRVPKRLPSTLDAGRTFVTGGQYSSQSLVRKTSKIVTGRRILKDTNNSENDFGVKTKADPSKSDASFID